VSAPPNEMSCRELLEVITDYLEEKMGRGDRLRFEAHLEECPDCVIYLEQMRETIDALGRLSEESIAPETRRELLDAFRGWRDGSRPR
jgi:anti-sigma factor RsiW